MKALYLSSPMDQFEIKPFFGNFLGLIYTPLGFITQSYNEAGERLNQIEIEKL